jgi:hypothetical protein
VGGNCLGPHDSESERDPGSGEVAVRGTTWHGIDLASLSCPARGEMQSPDPGSPYGFASWVLDNIPAYRSTRRLIKTDLLASNLQLPVASPSLRGGIAIRGAKNTIEAEAGHPGPGPARRRGSLLGHGFRQRRHRYRQASATMSSRTTEGTTGTEMGVTSSARTRHDGSSKQTKSLRVWLSSLDGLTSAARHASAGQQELRTGFEDWLGHRS